MVKPARGQARKLVVHHGAEPLVCVFAQPSQLDDRERLLHGIGQVSLHVAGQARIQKRALQRRLVAAGDGVKQDVAGHDARALAHVPDNVAQPHAGVFRRGCHGAANAQRAHGRLLGQRARLKRRQSGRFALASAFRLFSSHRRQVALVQKRQHAVQINVAVQRQVAVVQAVVALVLFQVVLVGKRGDSLGRAAGLERVRRVGEQACLQLVVQHAGRIG